MTTSEPYLHEFPAPMAPSSTTVCRPRPCSPCDSLRRSICLRSPPTLTWPTSGSAEHPEIEAARTGSITPARGLMGGRGLIGNGAATFEWRGQQLTTGRAPYRFWLMQRLHDDVAPAPPEERARIRDVFRHRP